MLNATVIFDPVELVPAVLVPADEDAVEDEELLHAASRPAEATASAAIPPRAALDLVHRR